MAGGWAGDRPKMPPGWHRIRARVLRDHPVCYVCRDRPSFAADHVVNRASGGTGPILGICKVCHAAKSSHEGNSAKRELRERRRRPEGRHPGLS